MKGIASRFGRFSLWEVKAVELRSMSTLATNEAVAKMGHPAFLAGLKAKCGGLSTALRFGRDDASISSDDVFWQALKELVKAAK